MFKRRIIIIGTALLLIGLLASFRFTQLALLPVAAFGCIVLILLFIDYPFHTLTGVLATRVLLDRFSEWGISLGGFHINLSALLALTIIAVTPIIMIRIRGRTPFGWTIPFALFSLLGLASVFYGLLPSNAFADAVRIVSYLCILVLASIIITPNRFLSFLKLFPLILVIPVLVGTYQLATGTGLYDFGRLKPIGTYFHPNYLGYGSLIALSIVFAYIWHVYTNRNRIANYKFQIAGYSMYGALLLFFVIRAQSLGAIFALLLVIMFIITSFINRHFIVIGIVGLFLAILFPWYNYSLQQHGIAVVDQPLFRIAIGERQEDGSFAWRVRNWQSMFGYVIQKPSIGWGLGTYKPLRAEQAEFETDLNALEAHNDYMNFTVEVGLIGTGLLLLSVLTFFIGIYRNSLDEANITANAAFVISALLLATAISMSVENLFKGAAIMWPLFALVGATIGQRRQVTGDS